VQAAAAAAAVVAPEQLDLLVLEALAPAGVQAEL
jgi:hypothetical protein